jgi:hypothetical protein
MFKLLIVVISFLFASVALPAFAHNPQEAKECAKASGTHSDLKSRNSFLASCLTKIDSRGFQLGEKAEQCEANTKNLKLAGDKKDEYFRYCYFKDDAHSSLNKIPNPKL